MSRYGVVSTCGNCACVILVADAQCMVHGARCTVYLYSTRHLRLAVDRERRAAIADHRIPVTSGTSTIALVYCIDTYVPYVESALSLNEVTILLVCKM